LTGIGSNLREKSRFCAGNSQGDCREYVKEKSSAKFYVIFIYNFFSQKNRKQSDGENEGVDAAADEDDATTNGDTKKKRRSKHNFLNNQNKSNFQNNKIKTKMRSSCST
jgi:hypothetical protein